MLLFFIAVKITFIVRHTVVLLVWEKKNHLQFQLWSDTFLVLQFYFIHTGRAFILNALKDNFKKSHHFHANKKRKNISQISWSRHSLNFFTFKGRHFWISSLEPSLSMFFCTTLSSLSSRGGDATFLKRAFHYHICVFLCLWHWFCEFWCKCTGSDHYARTAARLAAIVRCMTILYVFEC